MKRVSLAIAAFVAGALCSPAGAQGQAQQGPRSDLVAITVFVVDDEGRPVTGLTPDDFVVELDGERLPVRAVEYRQTTTTQRADAPDVGTGTAGRVFTILFDDLSFLPTSPDLPVLREALERFVAGLAPQDRIGVATTSGSGPRISPTADHARIATAVRALSGRAPQHSRVGFYVSLI